MKMIKAMYLLVLLTEPQDVLNHTHSWERGPLADNGSLHARTIIGRSLPGACMRSAMRKKIIL